MSRKRKKGGQKKRVAKTGDGEPPRDPVEVLGEVVGETVDTRDTNTGMELWAILAHVLFAGYLVGILYLGMRPGGRAPIMLYMFGPFVLAMMALLLIVVGVAWSALHRPFLQRKRLRAFLMVVVVFGTVNTRFPYPSSHEGDVSSTCFQLPGAGEWTVFWGGETEDRNRLSSLFPGRRWGLDLVVTQDGKSFAGEGTRSSDYFVFGREVTAPAAGVVELVRDGDPDLEPGGRVRPAHVFGNHVVLRVADGEYLFLCRLMRDSIEVAVGASVEQGQVIGRVGSSGPATVTPEPHLSLHLQDTPEAVFGEGIPWRFCGYAADGVSVERGLPSGGIARDGAKIGQRVSNE